MSIQGIALIDIVGLGLLILILNLIRTKKLHVGFAVIWFLAITGLMIIISVPSLLSLLPKVVGATFPASALSLVAFVFIFLVLIFFSVQLSVISARQVELAQAFALKELQTQEGQAEAAPSIHEKAISSS
jgi:hypothetical protein